MTYPGLFSSVVVDNIFEYCRSLLSAAMVERIKISGRFSLKYVQKFREQRKEDGQAEAVYDKYTRLPDAAKKIYEKFSLPCIGACQHPLFLVTWELSHILSKNPVGKFNHPPCRQQFPRLAIYNTLCPQPHSLTAR